MNRLVFHPGDVVYFKNAQKSNKANSLQGTFKGRGIGLFLGHAPELAPDPPAIFIFRQMGHFGFLTFDDVKEFLGEEAMVQAQEKFKDKYYGKEPDPAESEIPAEKPASNLIGIDGKPLS